MNFENQVYDEERALYGIKDSCVRNCRFDGKADGESAMKEASGIRVEGCYMNLRYPLWHVQGAEISGCTMTENCRAALWYDRDILLSNCRMNGIKALRECEDVRINDCEVKSPEFIWKCRNLSVENMTVAESEYPFFEVTGAKIRGLRLKGKYSFQYCSEIEITDSELDTKDAFWHIKNAVIRNTVIRGEYLGWYSENLTLINCRIIGTQPFCYCRNLTLKDCIMEDCDLAFERSTVNADVRGRIESVKNVLAGRIVADEIGEIISEEGIVDISKSEIIERKKKA